MDLQLTTLMGFMLALVRTTAWMTISPPFNNKSIPRLVKLGCAAGISMAVAPTLPASQLSFDTGDLLVSVVAQAVTGLTLGFLTQMLFSAVQSAGSLIDLFGGFTLSQALDPFGNNQVSIFGRFYSLLATVLLFAINGHLLLVKGFMTSFQAVPLGGIQLDSFKTILLKDLSLFGLASVEIAGPLLAAYFLADVALGLLSKAAPQLNVLTFGFPLKILLTLLMIASALPLIPGALHTLVNHALTDGMSILKGITPSSGGG